LIITSAIAVIAGGLLARRFSTIVVLLPAVVLAGVVSFLLAVVRSGSLAHGLWAALSVVVALQLGFLAGVVLNGIGVQRRTSQEGVVSRRVR
jgi:hypothetical protein